MTVETVRHWRLWNRPNITRGLLHELDTTYNIHGLRTRAQ